MTFLEALYGSQYYEIHQKGRDGNKGRLNGNLLLAALVVLFVFAVVMLCISFEPGFNETLTRTSLNIFGQTKASAIRKILAIPLTASVYILLSITAGSKENFDRKVDAFMQYPDEIKKNANKKALLPFLILGIIVFGLAFYNM